MMTVRHAVASSAVCSCRSVAARAQPLSYRQPLKSSFLGSRVTTASSRGKFLGMLLAGHFIRAIQWDYQEPAPTLSSSLLSFSLLACRTLVADPTLHYRETTS